MSLKRYFFFLFFATCSCLSAQVLRQGDIFERQLIDRFAEEMENDLGLSCDGTGGKFHDKLEYIEMSFNLVGRATVNEARQWAIYVHKRFLDTLNADENLRPYLIEFPFPPDRAGVSIAFCNPDGSKQSGGSVYYISLIGDLLSYSSIDAFNDRFLSLHKEEYEDALKKVTPGQKPAKHQDTPNEKTLDALFSQFTQEMADKQQLYVWGIGCNSPENLQEIGAKFTHFKPLHQEDARKLMILAVERLIGLVSKQEAFTSLKPEQINIRINFRNQKYTPYFDGSVESVTLEKGVLTYIRDPIWKEGDPFEELGKPQVVVGKESYQEARSLVENLN